MRFVQIGRTIINMDQVTDIDIHGDSVHIRFAVSESFDAEHGEMITRRVTLNGPRATALRAYLKRFLPDYFYVALPEGHSDDATSAEGNNTFNTFMHLHGAELSGANKIRDANRADLQRFRDQLPSNHMAVGVVEEIADMLGLRLKTGGES